MLFASIKSSHWVCNKLKSNLKFHYKPNFVIIHMSTDWTLSLKNSFFCWGDGTYTGITRELETLYWRPWNLLPGCIYNYRNTEEVKSISCSLEFFMIWVRRGAGPRNARPFPGHVNEDGLRIKEQRKAMFKGSKPNVRNIERENHSWVKSKMIC